MPEDEIDPIELHASIMQTMFDTEDMNIDIDVKFTKAELFLYHTLLQDFGLAIINEERFIPLMERNKRRLD